jgi:two-component system LytT family response regulator
MKSLRVILVDDERIARSRLRRLLEKEAGLEVVAECDDGPSAVEAVREHAPDLLFLDIQMPGKDGFDVLEALQPEEQPQVIFVTAYDEHAVRAFEACALDYLLKPTSPERLAKAVARARDRLAAGQPPPALTPDPGTQRFVVRSGGHLSFVATEEVDWVEAAGNYAILHVGKANHMIRETMAAMEEKLPDHFLRLNRSAIVNLRRVKELYSSPAGDHAAILHDGQRLVITRGIREVTDRMASL